MDFSAKQVAPPKSGAVFEDLCLALFRSVWQDSTVQKNGAPGQRNFGVDIFGINHAQGGGLWGVECKSRLAKDRLTRRDLEDILARADTFVPKLAQLIIATTQSRNAEIQEYARMLSAERAGSGNFPVAILAWEDILALLSAHQDVARRFYPEHFSDASAVSRHAYSTLSDQLLALNNLAASLQTQGNLPSAVALLETALKISHTLGEEHPHTLQTKTALAFIFELQGETAKAQILRNDIAAGKRGMALDALPIMTRSFNFWHENDANSDAEHILAAHRTWFKHIEINNFRCFDHLKIPFETQKTVIVARNGTGKTSVLDAIAAALGLFVECFYIGRALPFSDHDIRLLLTTPELGAMEPQYPAALQACAEIDSKSIEWLALKDRPEAGANADGARQIREIGQAMQKAVTDNLPVILPLLAYYGTSRLRMRTEDADDLRNEEYGPAFFSRTAGYQDCLNPASNYEYFEKWFIHAAKTDSDLRNQMREQKGEHNVIVGEADTPFTPLVKAVCQAVDDCLAVSGWRNLRFSFKHMALVMTHDEVGVLKINQLSDGVRSMIAMVADIAHRAVRLNANFGRDAARKTPGLVLIDEVDLHLHPAWQQVVLQKLALAFPCMQFVVTTHSPHIIQAADPKEIVSLGTEGKSVGRRALPECQYGFQGWTVEEVLLDVMGMTDTRTARYHNVLARFEQAIDAENYDEAQTAYKELDALLHPDNILRKLLRFELGSVKGNERD